MSNSNENRRRWTRYSLDAPIRVVSGTTAITGHGIRMSEGGISLFAVVNLPLGSQIKLEFTNPLSRDLVRIRGAVRNRAVYLYGVEFLAEEREDQQPAHLRQ